MAPARRPQSFRGTAALLLLGFCELVLGFSKLLLGFWQLSNLGFVSLGGSVRLQGRPARIAMAGGSNLWQVPSMPLPELNALPWANDLEGKDASTHASIGSVADKTVDSMEKFDQQLVESMSIDELHEAGRALKDLIVDFEGRIAERETEVLRKAMQVESETQMIWLESTMQTMGDLRQLLRRVRDREAKLLRILGDKGRGFLQMLARAAAIALGGQKAVPQSHYPASGASSYTMQPAETHFF